MADSLVNKSSKSKQTLIDLTKKFVTILSEAKDGVLDLDVAYNKLELNNKQRLYDIVNALEGIGLIERLSKKTIRWKGVRPGCNTQEAGAKLVDLKDELRRLEEHEDLLDTHTQLMQQSIKNIEADLKNRQYAYLTYEDIKEQYPEDRIIIIKAATDTVLKVSNLKMSDDKNDSKVYSEVNSPANEIEQTLAENNDQDIVNPDKDEEFENKIEKIKYYQPESHIISSRADESKGDQQLPDEEQRTQNEKKKKTSAIVKTEHSDTATTLAVTKTDLNLGFGGVLEKSPPSARTSGSTESEQPCWFSTLGPYMTD